LGRANVKQRWGKGQQPPRTRTLGILTNAAQTVVDGLVADGKQWLSQKAVEAWDLAKGLLSAGEFTGLTMTLTDAQTSTRARYGDNPTLIYLFKYSLIFPLKLSKK